jgi:hypothetical protein
MGMIYTLICNDGTKYVGDQTKTCANNGGTLSSSGGTIDWQNIAKELNKNIGFPDNSNIKYTPEPVRSKPVLCKDGTTKIQAISPNARVMDACENNGGRAENQTISVKQISEEVKLQNSKIGNKTLSTEEKFYESLGIKSEGGYDWTIKAKGRLLVLVALVGGYFAYKKFIK